MKPLTVAVTGGSCSGKTTFVKALVERIGDLTPVVLHQDHYFRDWSDLSEEERDRRRTANHPDAVQWDSLLDHIERLIRRESITTPPPHTRAAKRGDALTTVEATDLLIVEGHLLLTNAPLRDLMDIKLFLDVDAHERVLRRMLRDARDGRDSLERAAAWYRKDVLPNFPLHTEPTKRFADLIIPYQYDNQIALAAVEATIRAMLAG
ncbi:MAG: AAA family ATPase [Candidatus Poribacteria bacterium]|nr:AAA family ATPase [Candidatus Poribacteria bacterium]